MTATTVRAPPLAARHRVTGWRRLARRQRRPVRLAGRGVDDAHDIPVAVSPRLRCGYHGVEAEPAGVAPDDPEADAAGPPSLVTRGDGIRDRMGQPELHAWRGQLTTQRQRVRSQNRTLVPSAAACSRIRASRARQRNQAEPVSSGAGDADEVSFRIGEVADDEAARRGRRAHDASSAEVLGSLQGGLDVGHADVE
jgi:hypothetical protein